MRKRRSRPKKRSWSRKLPGGKLRPSKIRLKSIDKIAIRTAIGKFLKYKKNNPDFIEVRDKIAKEMRIGKRHIYNIVFPAVLMTRNEFLPIQQVELPKNMEKHVYDINWFPRGTNWSETKAQYNLDFHTDLGDLL